MADKKNFVPTIRLYSPNDLTKTWYISFKDFDGKRIRKYGYLNSLATAPERLQEAERLRREILDNYQPPPPSFKDQVFLFLEKQQVLWRPKSHQTYCNCAEKFFEWAKGREVTHDLVAAFFDHLLQTRSKTTYNKYREKLKRIFKGVGEEALFEGIDSVKENHTPARYFQRHQMRILKKAISDRDPQLWLFVQFIYYTFIRPGELRLIRAGDIFLDENNIIVKGEISKNKKTEYVAIPEPFRPQLEFVRRLHPIEYIFSSRQDNTKPIGVNTMSTRHRKILKELRFGPEYKLYSWKHTGAVQYIKGGGNIKQLQIQLRHHSLDQVNDYLRQMGVTDLTDLRANFPEL